MTEWRGKPKQTCSDNGPEYISAALAEWAVKHGVELKQKNVFVEQYNSTVRYEWLSQYLFNIIAEAQDHATEWLWFCDNERPNKAICGIPSNYK